MDIQGLDFNLLKTLEALLTQGSVSGAARHLGLSQPAASAALARLRTALDDPLLIRKGNVMLRTARAEELLPRAIALVEEISQIFLLPDAFDAATSTRHFRILANDYAATHVLSRIAADLRVCAPGVVLEILPFDRTYADRFAMREADLALSDNYSLQDYRHSEVLAREHYVSIVRADHPRLGDGAVTLDAFLAEEHALVSRKGLVPGVVDKALASIGESRRVVLTLPYFASAPAVLTCTDLVMTVPAGIARTFKESHDLRLFDPPVEVASFDVVFAWAARSAADPAKDWIRDKLAFALTMEGAPTASQPKIR